MFFEANREITREYLKELRQKRRIDTQIFEDVSQTLMEILNANEDKERRVEMSIRTAADEQLEKARDSVESAIHALDSIVIKQCGGSDKYKDTFITALEKSLFSLIGIRKDLK